MRLRISIDHADDCLICSRERKAAMRSFGPTAGSRADWLGDWAEKGFAMMSILGTHTTYAEVRGRAAPRGSTPIASRLRIK